MIDNQEEAIDLPKSFSMPWMKYVVVLEGAFRKAEGDYVETSRLADAVESFLICDPDSFVDGGFRIVEDHSSIPKLTLPEASEVKSQEGQQKFSARLLFQKDLQSLISERITSCLKQKKEKKEESTKRKTSEASNDYIYNLYIPKKRSSYVYPVKFDRGEK